MCLPLDRQRQQSRRTCHSLRALISSTLSCSTRQPMALAQPNSRAQAHSSSCHNSTCSQAEIWGAQALQPTLLEMMLPEKGSQLAHQNGRIMNAPQQMLRLGSAQARLLRCLGKHWDLSLKVQSLSPTTASLQGQCAWLHCNASVVQRCVRNASRPFSAM